MNSGTVRATFLHCKSIKRYLQHTVMQKEPLGVTLVLASMVLVAGCTVEDGFSQTPFSDDGLSTITSSSSKVVEHEIEAPEIFQMSAEGVWDGRPSLGGVWVAHASAKSAERVIIRDVKSGEFVIGALFRRDPVKSGPSIQISAAAAQGLGAMPGQPVKLDVTALRAHRAVPKRANGSEAPAKDVVATATDALNEVEATTSLTELRKPFIQLGIFNVEQNAKNTATVVRQVGVVPLIKQQSRDGKPFWRVLVGPANSLQERAILLKTVKSVGFQDAYAVTH